MDSKVCECCQELTGGFPLCLDQFFFEKNDLQRPKMLKKWFLVIFKAHSPLRQKNGIFKRDQTQNHACLTQTNDFIPYTNIYNQIIIWGPYLAISGHCGSPLTWVAWDLEAVLFPWQRLTSWPHRGWKTGGGGLFSRPSDPSWQGAGPPVILVKLTNHSIRSETFILFE